MYTGIHAYAHTWKPWTEVEHPVYHAPLYFFKSGSLAEPGVRLSARSGNPDSAHHGAGVTVAARFLYKHGEGYILLLALQELPSSLLPSHFSSFNSCDFHIV